MKRSVLFLTIIATALMSAPRAFGQESDTPFSLHEYSKSLPLSDESLARARSAVGANASTASPSTIPTWSYSIVAPKDGKTYTGTMVGANPFFNGARTIKIPTFVIPLIVVMPDGSRFDPTATDGCERGLTTANALIGSPIFQNYSFNMNGINIGSGQYIDEFQRANFFDADVLVTGDSYHNVLNPVTVLAPITVNIPANKGASWSLGGCANLGVVDFSVFSSIVSNTLIPSLGSRGVGTTSFPFFLLRNVVMGDPGDSPYSSCCVIGYHGAQGFPVQTYAVADLDSTGVLGAHDISATSHEVGEWMDDPFGTNPTPNWGHTGQVSGCQNNLEVGDPLSGSTFNSAGINMPNGITYHPQQLAFFSWFYGQIPSLGAGGMYSDAGVFSGPAPSCS